MKFINRGKELEALDTAWGAGEPQFFVIYGKRRVGKTELVKQFIKDKPSVYFLADKRSIGEQLKELGRIVGHYFDDRILAKNGFSDWLEAFEYLARHVQGSFVLAIDEYPYLVENDSSISSVFQKGWDEYLRKKNIFLVLLGSSIGIMESEALIHTSPLFGRRTGQILVKPLSFRQSAEFFPKKSFKDFLSLYTVTDGMPAYVLQFEEEKTLKQLIQERVFPPTVFLHNEVEFTLKEELREPKNYLSILRAISWGKRKFGEIANETGLEKGTLTKYLVTLERLHLIEREYPVTEKNPHKSRKGLYRISDNFFRFWFQYVFPYKSDLEIGRYKEVLRKMDESFITLEAVVYEKVCQEIVWEFCDAIFPFERAGKWWEKEKELDVVAINESTKQILFGECKWSEKPVGTNVYEQLRRVAGDVQWNKNDRKEYFILFSKSGFTKGMLKAAKQDGVFLVAQDTLVYAPAR